MCHNTCQSRETFQEFSLAPSAAICGLRGFCTGLYCMRRHWLSHCSGQGVGGVDLSQYPEASAHAYACIWYPVAYIVLLDLPGTGILPRSTACSSQISLVTCYCACRDPGPAIAACALCSCDTCFIVSYCLYWKVQQHPTSNQQPLRAAVDSRLRLDPGESRLVQNSNVVSDLYVWDDAQLQTTGSQLLVTGAVGTCAAHMTEPCRNSSDFKQFRSRSAAPCPSGSSGRITCFCFDSCTRPAACCCPTQQSIANLPHFCFRCRLQDALFCSLPPRSALRAISNAANSTTAKTAAAWTS